MISTHAEYIVLNVKMRIDITQLMVNAILKGSLENTYSSDVRVNLKCITVVL
jgi:ATP-dependent phosphoenolpyruvate carboxykinase